MSHELEGSPAAKRPASVVYQREKKTKASVLFTDAFAQYGITIGGMLVIIAVFTIMIFLIYVCLPLLNAGETTGTKSYKIETSAAQFVETQIDEQQTIFADLETDGHIKAFHLGTGTPLEVPSYDLSGLTASAFAATLRGDDILFGFPDGSVRAGRFELRSQVMASEGVPTDLRKLDARDSTDGKAVYSKIPGQFRKTSIEISLEPATQIAPVGTAILKADYRVGGTAERPLKTFVTLDAAGKLRLSQAYSEINMMTGEAATQLTTAEIPLQVPAADVVKLLLNTQGDRVLVTLRDGTIYRYNTRNFANPQLAETVKVISNGVELSAASYQNGENSIIVGGSDGSVAIWFGVDRQSKDTTDGIVLTKVHAEFEKQKAAITDIRVSQRTRMFTTSDRAGNVWVRHGTTERTLLTLPGSPDPTGLQATVFAPKDDGVLAIGKNGNVILWGIRVPHPETTLQSVFGKVWYEGYTEPVYVWQSTSGTDASEPKLSLIPLIFGTFKAAIYSLMLAIPIALMAAIYTSEFMKPSTRAVVKPVMELMATLPSVVVGFVAALVLSPIVESWIAAIVIAFGVIPLALITMSFLWQLLPTPIANLLDGLPKLLAFFATILGAVWVSRELGPLVETTFFDGDFKKWTSGAGSAQPFLFLLLIPASFVLVLVLTRPIYSAAYRLNLRELPKFMAAARELFGWFVILALSLGTAWGLSMLLGQLGLDARGGLVDTYVQRNALVAAFAIAFAEIPIIYTISEDALNAVPSYLRSGSLACGASKWQTTSRIVLPTAASGIFSAIMIGLGRAVGETMIVVMATGNTPLLDINIFNGLRTLSANINVELPEAVRDSTLYRTLFLCALVLFFMTFVINTIAELVRQRYRKRAAQL
ncbi:MAG: ABC transporter permease subunit [Alphaproteobacteria bacterium]|nr:ABC transporter permease subunit [Alphaproteobacteria bacterium]